MTPAEITALERRIAEEVMGWETHTTNGVAWWSEDLPGRAYREITRFNPHRNEADALEVLKWLIGEHLSYSIGVTFHSARRTWLAFVSNSEETIQAEAPGPHFGPAVCELARKFLDGPRQDPARLPKRFHEPEHWNSHAE